jgi:VIT1/CCC1 family predicted Fe2+/Mn2+ transporter
MPFLLIPRIRLAARASDVIAITMLFLAGHAYGKYAGHQAWGWGLSMVMIGGLMVALTIGLGG